MTIKDKTNTGSPIVQGRHTIIPACDTDLDTFREIVRSTHEMDGVGGYKVGFCLALTVGLPEVVRVVREYTRKPVIYDHQKAATDIPDTGGSFAAVCKSAGVDAVILFPLTGPKVLKSWVEACCKEGLGVIVGGVMTHEGFLVSEGGFVSDDAAYSIYVAAAELGVTEFVVPATRPDFSWEVFATLQRRGYGATFYSPGIGAQGGCWAALCRKHGPAWHAIVGRSLFQQGDIRTNVEALLATLPVD